MGRRRCFARFWTSKRRKAAAFSAGEWRRWLQYQEEYEQRGCSLNDGGATRFRRPLALVRPVALWPSAGGYVPDGDRGTPRALIELVWMALSAAKASLEATVLTSYALSARRCWGRDVDIPRKN